MSCNWQHKASRSGAPRADDKIFRHPIWLIYPSIKLCMLRLAMVIALFTGPRLALADSHSPDNDFDLAIKSLCQSKDTEGSYDLKLDGASARLWVICQSETRILASTNIPDFFTRQRWCTPP
jgi:hypothetical protein